MTRSPQHSPSEMAFRQIRLGDWRKAVRLSRPPARRPCFDLACWLFRIRFPFFLPDFREHLVYLGSCQRCGRAQDDGDPTHADHHLNTGERPRKSVRWDDVSVSQRGHGDDREIDELSEARRCGPIGVDA